MDPVGFFIDDSRVFDNHCPFDPARERGTGTREQIPLPVPRFPFPATWTFPLKTGGNLWYGFRPERVIIEQFTIPARRLCG